MYTLPSRDIVLLYYVPTRQCIHLHSEQVFLYPLYILYFYIYIILYVLLYVYSQHHKDRRDLVQHSPPSHSILCVYVLCNTVIVPPWSTMSDLMMAL
jgi:hypothetical protein